jgi:protein O-GlcNAc transferase
MFMLFTVPLQRGGLPPMPFVYSSFNQLYKTDPGIFKIWMKGLSEISHAALWLIEIHTTETQGVFRREAEAVGVSGSRIHFTRGYSEEEHLLIKGAADVFLDTPSCVANITAFMLENVFDLHFALLQVQRTQHRY